MSTYLWLQLSYRFSLLFGHSGNSVHPPDLAEHGAVGEREAQGEEPGARVASHRERRRAHETAIQTCERERERDWFFFFFFPDPVRQCSSIYEDAGRP